MAHRIERYDCHFVCDDHRDDSSAEYGKLDTVSDKSHWRRARIHFDRRVDLLARSLEREINLRVERHIGVSGIENRKSPANDVQRRPSFPNRKSKIGNRKFNEPAVGFEPTTC